MAYAGAGGRGAGAAEKSAAAAGAIAFATGGRNQSPRLSRCAGLGHPGATGVPRALRILVRHRQTTADHGAEPDRAGVEDSAQYRVYVWRAGNAGNGRRRLRHCFIADRLGHLPDRLGLVPQRAGICRLRDFQPLERAESGAIDRHAAPWCAHRGNVSGGCDRLHFHGAVHRAAGADGLGRAPNRRQSRRAALYAAVGGRSSRRCARRASAGA